MPLQTKSKHSKNRLRVREKIELRLSMGKLQLVCSRQQTRMEKPGAAKENPKDQANNREEEGEKMSIARIQYIAL